MSLTTEVLLVEDSPTDVEITKRAVRDAAPSVVLRVAPSGPEALDYLYRRGAYADARLPGREF